ncbi:MAG: hypothetical protein A3I88_03775 [Candidatus Portnoybacteria bacterium RIFCSPLOWO2_12_FULL_39_9]|uniref:Fimbrial assembly protein n=1 Tax=Candidatus Portnoybacteria bacterium RIFCSPHIGHO2_12_FULL_38_9 TaxID=1801997 RepID=A0A1G2FHN7_9BACT|nr:MAG: hypothetical protein A3H00_03050 [Candidatus Portnoybacteria bacterium RBG_13_40_8]OGZ37021.1 MAG: hypothetical protein A3J64_01900 [Candidatus Portnoybacteria bacterium RIFCSPHIGHO2_12_FULL_38_9]OGZ38624.1 MAG: hypothetical protein A3F21_01220 [Candidatus Portnoybacteria bacterium RIFCSPLOWO2_01_FULL_38_39]OGZ40488.1 MAG: hypothetical protein A3I88_03775 [Candidatus Portnoybacteria bacterium RIFCSPLOWO2_12_FULL_39_9]
MIQLNLLPPKEKKEFESTETRRWFFLFGNRLFFFLIIFILLCLSAYFYLSIILKSQEKLIEIEENHFKTSQLSQLEREIEQTNQKLQEIYNLQKDLKPMTPVLEKLTDLRPEGVYLIGLSYQKDDGQISLNGRADSREQFLVFQKNLGEEPRFIDLNSPISNLLKQRDINFNLTFKVKDNDNTMLKLPQSADELNEIQ